MSHYACLTSCRCSCTVRDPSWLVQSLTHVSVLGGVSYQRLEFLGDALMDLIVSLRLLAMGHGTQ